MKLSDLDLTKSYTYEDYLTWDFPERVELIDGKVFVTNFIDPDRDHKAYAQRIAGYLRHYFRSIGCKVFSSPFDVSSSNDDDSHALHPNLNIIAGDTGANAAPDLVISLSPGSRDLNPLLDQYAKDGIKEYWIVSPYYEYVAVCRMNGDAFLTEGSFIYGSMITSPLIPELALSVTELFAQ